MDKFTVVGGHRCELYGPAPMSMCQAFVNGYTKTGDFGGWDWIDIKDSSCAVVERFQNPWAEDN